MAKQSYQVPLELTQEQMWLVLNRLVDNCERGSVFTMSSTYPYYFGVMDTYQNLLGLIQYEISEALKSPPK